MANASGLITAPVRDKADVATVLGVSNCGVSYLCSNQHGKIAPWSRRKPIRLSTISPNRSGQWWKGDDGNCGISPKSFSNYRDIYNYCDGSMNGWQYLPPTGGSTSPYRLADFDGYYHYASAPISNFQCPSSTNTVSQFTCTADVVINSEDSTSEYLILNDIDYVKNCYFGIVAKNGSTYKRLTSSQTIGSTGASVTMPAGKLTAGTWEIYPFLSNQIIDVDAADLNNLTYYSIPYMSKKSISVSSVASGISISMEGLPLPSSAGYVTVPVYVRNNNSVAASLTSGQWKCRYGYNSYDDTMLSTETSGSISNTTVSAGSTQTINISVRVTAELIAYGSVKVYVSFLANGTRYTGEMEFAVEQID